MIQFTNNRIAGGLPAFFDENDPRSARDQLHENYAYGGGVRPFKGFTLHGAPLYAHLSYPGDPSMMEVARAKIRDELLILFQGSWLAIIQPDGSHIITRVD